VKPNQSPFMAYAATLAISPDAPKSNYQKEKALMTSTSFRPNGAWLWLAAFTAAALIACGGSGPVDPLTACLSLKGMQIPASAIGKATSGAAVQTANFVKADAAGNKLGEYCAVTGQVMPASAGAPNMEFEVNLPTDWKGRALQMGGGGYDGFLVTGLDPFTSQPASVKHPLTQGFVTLGSDGGHKAAPGNFFDGNFASNDEALLNYGQLSVKKTHDVAMAIIQQRYGSKPDFFYFIGGSQGGHEALDAAARYAADYDGVIANYPAYNLTMLQQSSLYVGQALYANGGASWINPAKKALLVGAVYAACDGLDGAKDGIISNVAACKTAFDVQTLRCAAGADLGDTCLSDAQIAAVRKIASPFTLPFEVAGQSSYPGWPVLEGATFDLGFSTFGTAPQPSNPPGPTDGLLYSIGAAQVKYLVTKNPAFDAMTFNPTAWKDRLQQLGTITDVTTVSLDAFRAKGGKVILTHGTADNFISPHGTTAYYQRQVDAFGQSTVDSFLRYYQIPGFDHGFGAFNLVYDGLAVLQNWVEKGQAPTNLVGADGNPGATRTRPMCQYGTWPKFTGAAGASIDVAANYTCVTQ
jgi:pimeloyl-ACP methyl ester carboxylesterase